MATRLRLAVDTGDVARLRDLAAIERLVKTDKVPVDAEIAHIIGDSSMSRSINASAHKSEAEDPLCKQGLVVGIRARARECLAAKLEPEEKAEEVD